MNSMEAVDSNIASTFEGVDVNQMMTDELENNDTINLSSPKVGSNNKILTSTYSLNRQYSSPCVLDASPVTEHRKKNDADKQHQQLPSTPTTANLTPIIRNTDKNPSIISPETDIRNMSIPLLSTKPHASSFNAGMTNDQISLKRIHRSFTNARQFQRTLSTPTNNDFNHQYQPSRDNSFSDFGIAEPEDLSIFMDENPLPFERQLSIPSIRLANHLADSCEQTCSDDEDDLFGFVEHPRIDSSNLNTDALNTSLDTITTIHDDDDYDDEEEEILENNVQILFRQKQDDPYEWLQQMRGDGVLVEAASSKFLTRGYCNDHSVHTNYTV